MSENVHVYPLEEKDENIVLSCSSCRHIKENIKTFPCLHSLCEECYKVNENEARLICKLCPDITFGDDSDFYQLQDNIFTREYLSMQAVLNKSQSNISCENCYKAKPKEADTYCFDCNRFMCRSDMKAHLDVVQSSCTDTSSTHMCTELIDIKQKHPIELMHFVKERLIQCDSHSYPAEYYCLQDGCWICHVCKEGNHHSHDMMTCKEVQECWINDLKVAQEKLTFTTNEHNTYMQEIIGMKDKIDNTEKSLIENIDQTFLELIEKIKAKQLQTIQEAKTKFSDQREMLSSQVNAIKSNIARLDNANSLVNFSLKISSNEFLKFSASTMKQYIENFEREEINFTPTLPDVVLRQHKPLDEYSNEFCTVKVQDNSQAAEVCFGAYGQFKSISDVTVDKEGRIHVVDSQAYSVKAFNSEGKALTQFGSHGEKVGQFMRPWGICTKDNFIYVSDYIRHNVQMFNIDGKHIKQVGKYGAGKNSFNEPRGMEADDFIYICDRMNSRIQVYSLNLEYLNTLGHGVKLHQPRDIAISGSLIIVLDSGNPCIHVMLKTDEIVYTFCEKGPGLRLIDPWFIAAADEGLCFVSDWKRNAIVCYTISGEFRYTLNRHGDISGAMCQPNGLYLDAKGMLVVGETGNSRIQIMKPFS